MRLLTSPTQAVEPVQVQLDHAALRAQLLSLALLTETDAALNCAPWVHTAAERLTAQQRQFNQALFGGLGGALHLVMDAADVPAALTALARQTPEAVLADAAVTANAATPERRAELGGYLAEGAALRDAVIAHLAALWDVVLASEWRRHEHNLRLMMQTLRDADRVLNDAAPVLSRLRAITHREAPEWALAPILRAREIVVALSPHVAYCVADFGIPDIAHVFVQADNAILRLAPVNPAEVLGPLGALADETRLRLLELLAAHGELRGQEIIAQLGVSQPVVSRNLKQLVGAGLVEERRAGDTNKLYRLKSEGARAIFGLLLQLLSPDNARADLDQHRAVTQRNAALAAYPADLQPFIDQHGRVHRFSAKRTEQQPVLDYLFSRIAAGCDYTERQINELIGSWLVASRHGPDPVTIRRALVEERGLRRTSDGARYWRE
jgi:DNA-binding transcriptional ArsR family regulator